MEKFIIERMEHKPSLSELYGGEIMFGFAFVIQLMEEYHLSKLRQHDVRYQLAISALEAIADPIGHMKKQLKEDERLDGMYAIRIAERPEFYQDIAKKALEEIANCT